MKILIANRGEIARRIARTVHAMGHQSVAVFSDADRAAPFVRECDEAVHIGPAPSAESYLVIEAILGAAKRTGADAVHPGYGFLAENAAFAEAAEAAGLIFVGPSPEAIRAMGSKIEAKRLMREHGVPVVPGYDGADQSDETLGAEAESIGYPVLLKASAGGGGKGMRVVREPSELAAAIAAARREALAAFSDDKLLIEKFIERPRHIEVQIMGDGEGKVLHLYERECSVQRRHQKIIEETPSPSLDRNPELRQRMCAAAVAAGAALDYRSAGTVEFILTPDGEFYFLEMNTRLQVEHPVTEETTGLDLVELQLAIAAGDGLTLDQAAIVQTGHSIECRLYAEDPAGGFLPATGTLRDWHPDADLRVDSGIETGSEISIHYDPMIAKIISKGRDRATSTRKMVRGLRRLSALGLTTNRRYLVEVLSADDWIRGEIDTQWVERNPALAERPTPRAATERALITLTLALTASQTSTEPASTRTLQLAPGWRNNRWRPTTRRWTLGDASFEVSYLHQGQGLAIDVSDPIEEIEPETYPRTPSRHARVLDRDGASITTEIDGLASTWRVVSDGDTAWIHGEGLDWTVHAEPDLPVGASDDADSKGCVAPMPSKVLKILVSEGESVTVGQSLMIVEAMKMETTLEADRDGVVAEILAAEGELVDADTLLLRIEERAEA